MCKQIGQEPQIPAIYWSEPYMNQSCQGIDSLVAIYWPLCVCVYIYSYMCGYPEVYTAYQYGIFNMIPILESCFVSTPGWLYIVEKNIEFDSISQLV